MKRISNLSFQSRLFSLCVIASLFIQMGLTTPVLATSQASVQSDPFTACTDVTGIPQAECEALLALYNSTNGAGWVNNIDWLITDTPCSWYGVGCGGGHVTLLSLRANQLSGNIPTELGNLTQLTELKLENNQLTGSIPVALGNLTLLTALRLPDNQLTGSIPVELGNLMQLYSLELSNNQLTGSIPVQLGNLTQLIGLYLNNNLLSGSIPLQFGNLTHLVKLRLENNQLSGSIPMELGNLTQLTTLNLSINQLSGSIPVELGNLTLLTVLELRINQLSGRIPAQLGNLTQLTSLALDLNQLSDSIPPALGNLTQLTFLSLAGNQLTGNIPAELGNLTQLTWLGVCNNQLTGSIPKELGNLAQLEYLWLQGNQLTGSIPVELGNLTQLYTLELSDNHLTGNIPAELGNLTQLIGLYLQYNQLSGEFPTSITNLVNLTTLTFDCNLTSSDPVVIAFLNEKSPGWQVNQCLPNSHIIASPKYNWVHAFGWPNGTSLTMTIDSSVPFHATVGPSSGDPNQFAAEFNLGGFDLQAGQLITVTDNGNPAVVRTFSPTNLTITGFNVGANTMSGTAAPDAEVQACFRVSGNCVTRVATADENGNWTVDYSGIGVVLGSTKISATESDSNGNKTHFGWRNPYFWVWPRGGAFVETVDWPLNDPLTLRIYDSSGNLAHGPYYQTTGPAPWTGVPVGQAYARFDFTFDIPAGHVISITDGVMTRTHTVTVVEVTNVDPITNIVTGIATPGRQVEVGPEGNFDTVTADENGNWSIDFSGMYDILPGDWVEAFENDDDGDFTAAGKEALEPNRPQLTALSPAKVWVGLKNSDDVGTKFDLLAEIYQNNTLVGSGEFDKVNGGSSGFNNAKLNTIPLTLFAPIDWTEGSTLSMKLYVRNTCFGNTHNSGTARLWYNDASANSQFGATIDDVSQNYFLRDGFTLSLTPGSGPRKTIDVAAGKPCSPFKLFGTWSIAP